MTDRDEILQLARSEGFELARIAPASVLVQARARATSAKANGLLDGMDWITEEWLQRATAPELFLEGAKSVLVVALSYPEGEAPPQAPGTGTRGRVAAYAQGRDYHRVFEKRIRRVARRLRERHGCGARATVDYGPLLERPLATISGMGWTGKSTMLLVPGLGPWVLLGAIATTLELEPDRPLAKSCGSCTRCIAACPTGALSLDGRLDAQLCISYHTIENRGVVPRDLRAKFGSWVFGCDDCLSSCPVGAGKRRDSPHPDLASKTVDDAWPELESLLSLTEAEFQERFRGRAIMRAKRDGLVRNACIALGNTGSRKDMSATEKALYDRSALVRGHAAWALGRLGVRHQVQSLAATTLASRREKEDDAWVQEEIDAALEVLGANRR